MRSHAAAFRLGSSGDVLIDEDEGSTVVHTQPGKSCASPFDIPALMPKLKPAANTTGAHLACF